MEDVQSFLFDSSLLKLHYVAHLVHTENHALSGAIETYLGIPHVDEHTLDSYTKTFCQNVHAGIGHINEIDMLSESLDVHSERLFFKMSCEILDLGADDTGREVFGIHLWYADEDSPFNGLHEDGKFETDQDGFHLDINNDSATLHLNRTLGNE
jgi:hypothetical protein